MIARASLARLSRRATWLVLLLATTSLGASCRDPVPEPPAPRPLEQPGPKAPEKAPTLPASAPAAVSAAQVAPAGSGPVVAALPPHRVGHDVLREEKTPYGHFKVQDFGSKRTLLFVRDSGEEVVESIVNLDRPDQLEVAYTRAMFASFLFRPQQQRCLIVGLGGGGMVRFLNHYFPEVAVDAVEIDPAIARAAAELFGVGPGPKTRIVVEDGFTYLAREGDKYDVIYMDAFLKPGSETDLEGAPRRLKTDQFLKGLQKRLLPDGMLVVNLNEQPDTPSDLATLKAAFASTYVFPVPNTGNIIVVASTAKQRVADDVLKRNGADVDKRGQYGFSFAGLVDFKAR